MFRSISIKIILCLVFGCSSLGLVSAYAQEKNEHGFRVNGFMYSDVNVPMNRMETQILQHMREMVARVINGRRQEEFRFPTGVSSKTIRSVKVNIEKTYILVDLERSIMMREGPEGLEGFLHQLRMSAMLATEKLMGKSLNVIFVYGGEKFGYGRMPPGFKKLNAIPQDTRIQSTSAPAAFPSTVPGVTTISRDRVVVSAAHGLFRKLDSVKRGRFPLI